MTRSFTLSIVISLIFTFSLKSLVSTLTYTCHEDEISLENWCYKLTSASLSKDLSMCESLTASLVVHEYFACLKDLLNKVFQIYTDNLYLDPNYEFTILDAASSVLRKLISTVPDNVVSANIFINYFSHNFHGYIENQPKNDEIPNLMMHPEEALSNLTEVCIIGQQIQSNNESFKFKYSECSRNYPFICIKPLKQIKEREKISGEIYREFFFSFISTFS